MLFSELIFTKLKGANDPAWNPATLNFTKISKDM